MEAHGFIRAFMILLLLFCLIGINSVVHNDFSKGFVFLVLVFLILLTGIEPAENFFGASALAMFIAIHLSLFGFNSIPLVASFLVFVLFRSFFMKNLLLPITVYLAFDSAFNYFGIEKIINSFTETWGKKIFSFNGFAFLTVVLLTYCYLQIERLLKKKYGKSFYGQYGAMMLIGVLLYLSFIIGIIMHFMWLQALGSLWFVLYIIGAMHFDKESKKFLVLVLPVFLLFAIIKLIKLIKLYRGHRQHHLTSQFTAPLSCDLTFSYHDFCIRVGWKEQKPC